ncbi:hypothetical protein CC1_14510 [Coprococcus catus GD/7]|uniref:Uncharacterized protein n=1 Tax=Coprococcus catus GD/7 TaxID=717962 RepID=D4J7B1_9FIRM|nr:hypothetical protein CC1_14510 [Coprococcus catus GD/7]
MLFLIHVKNAARPMLA